MSYLSNFLDINGIRLGVDDEVNVPEPNEFDAHKNPFTGFIVDILDNGNAIIEDGDGDCFEVECDRLESI